MSVPTATRYEHITAALLDQRRHRHGKEPLAREAVAADAVAVRTQLADPIMGNPAH